MDKFLETLKGLLQKGNALLGKLPFKGLAEKYIPESAKAKVPFLETIVTPYANQIVAGLAALLLVAAVGGSGGGGGSSLKGSTWEGKVITPAFADLSGFGINSGSPGLRNQTTFVFDSKTVRMNRVEFNAKGNRVNPSSKTGSYTVDGNIVSITFDDGILDGIIEGSTLTVRGAVYTGNIVFKPAASKNQKGGSGPTPESDFTVTLTRDNAGVVIEKYNGRASRVNIPTTIQGLPVREIGDLAFYNNIIIISVVIPEGVTSIGGASFCGCSNLSSVTLPSTLARIGSEAFKRCSSLTSISFPAGLIEIGVAAFEESGLTSFPDPWPKAITVIRTSAFNETNIRALVIPEGITEIGSWAFSSCSNLTSVTLPSTLNEIGGNAFYECPNLDLASQARLREFYNR